MRSLSLRELPAQLRGTPVAYRSDRFPDEIDFYAASLEDPASVTPQFHTYWAEKLPWITYDDGLPRHERGAS